MAYYDSDMGAAFSFSEILERIDKIGWGNYIIIYNCTLDSPFCIRV